MLLGSTLGQLGQRVIGSSSARTRSDATSITTRDSGNEFFKVVPLRTISRREMREQCDEE